MVLRRHEVTVAECAGAAEAADEAAGSVLAVVHLSAQWPNVNTIVLVSFGGSDRLKVLDQLNNRLVVSLG